MSIAIGVITAPRPIPTLRRSVQSMHDAGFGHLIHIFAEPGSSDIPVELSQVRIHQHKTKKGNFRNWVLAAQHLLEDTADQWIMICEDDIQWARNAASVLEYDLPRLKFGGWHALSLYTCERMSKLIEQQSGRDHGLTFGWYHLAVGKKMWGAQCLVFNREHLSELLRHEYIRETWRDANEDTKNIDLHVSVSLTNRAKTILYRIPCLVDHIGDRNSSLYGDKDRPALRTKYFKDPAA